MQVPKRNKLPSLELILQNHMFGKEMVVYTTLPIVFPVFRIHIPVLLQDFLLYTIYVSC
jgi:hypothetical protein